MSEEIELYGIKVSVPKHPRFFWCPDFKQWFFQADVFSRVNIANLFKEDSEGYKLVQESACCIAIVWCENQIGERPCNSGAFAEYWKSCNRDEGMWAAWDKFHRTNAESWKRLLAASQADAIRKAGEKG